MPAGRPTKMTKTLLAKLEEAFAFGCSDEEACLYADIQPSTMYRYQEDHPEFKERKARLKQNPILEARKSVITGMKDNPRLALDFLKARKSDEFSERKQLDHQGADEIIKALQAARERVQPAKAS